MILKRMLLMVAVTVPMAAQSNQCFDACIASCFDGCFEICSDTCM